MYLTCERISLYSNREINLCASPDSQLVPSLYFMIYILILIFVAVILSYKIIFFDFVKRIFWKYKWLSPSPLKKKKKIKLINYQDVNYTNIIYLEYLEIFKYSSNLYIYIYYNMQ